MTRVQRAVHALKKQHKTWRAAGSAVGVNHAYLYRLYKGERENPNETVLTKLGLVKQTIYRTTEDV